MTREDRLKFCKKCTKRKFDLNKGIVCGLTMEQANFEKECNNFEEDLLEAEKTVTAIEYARAQNILNKLPEEKIAYFKEHQNLQYAILGGIEASLICALIWAFITSVSHMQIGFMAIGVGLIVGAAVNYFGNGIDKIYGFIGAVFAFLGCFIGNFFSSVALIAFEQNLDIGVILTSIDWDFFTLIVKETFQPMDILFYLIAIAEGYKFSFRAISLEDLQQKDEQALTIKYEKERKTKVILLGIIAIILITGYSYLMKSTEGMITYYHKNGLKQSEGEIKNGKLNGLWTFWNEEGKLHSTQYLIDGLEDGMSTWFNNDERIIKTVTYKKGIPEGPWVSFYENGQKSNEGYYSKCRMNGFWISYFDSGQKYSEGKYVREREDSLWKYWNEAGLKIMEGFYKDGEKIGTWKYWNDQGNLKEIIRHEKTKAFLLNCWNDDGKQIIQEGTGVYTTYHPNGKINLSVHVKKGIFTGNQFIYYDDGSLMEEGNYSEEGNYLISKYYLIDKKQSVQNGNGTYKLVDENGNLLAQGNYEAGLKKGEWIYYYDGINIMQSVYFENGKMNGSFKQWSPEGILIFEGNFKNEKKEGTWTWYHENGAIQTSINYIQDQKHGMQTFSSEFSLPLLEEEYSYGTLIRETVLQE